jgi:hypothetical protein
MIALNFRVERPLDANCFCSAADFLDLIWRQTPLINTTISQFLDTTFRRQTSTRFRFTSITSIPQYPLRTSQPSSAPRNALRVHARVRVEDGAKWNSQTKGKSIPVRLGKARKASGSHLGEIAFSQLYRKTGLTLPDTGVRDENGFEPMDNLFSSPEQPTKGRPKKVNSVQKNANATISSEEDMDVVDSMFRNLRAVNGSLLIAL